MKSLLLRLIRLYQALSRNVSTPLMLGAYSGCRSWPTCSDYAYETIERDGVLHGGARAVARFIRCQPFTTPRT